MTTQEQIIELLEQNDFSNIKAVEYDNHGTHFNVSFRVPTSKQITENTMQRLFNQMDMLVLECLHGDKVGYVEIKSKED